MAQIVSLGKTQSGIPGLFTSGFLVWSIGPEQYDTFTRDPAALRKYVEHRGFALDLSAPIPAPSLQQQLQWAETHAADLTIAVHNQEHFKREAERLRNLLKSTGEA